MDTAKQDNASRVPRARPGGAISRVLGWLGRVEPLYGLAGPILEKELRVSARRRRSYWLRVGYVAFLGLLVVMVWGIAVTEGRHTPSLFGMAEVGLILTTSILWFQFLVLPLVAIAMFSTSINEEVHKRTLGVLMTAPISNFDIVAGKFLGKFLQLALLVALSLPILALVRVLGGVTWEFVLAGTCVTLTSALFCGAVSMLYSTTSRSAVAVILKTVGLLMVLFLAIPMVWTYAAAPNPSPGPSLPGFLLYTNPFAVMSYLTEELHLPRKVMGWSVHWWVHALIMLAATAGLLAWSMARVRRTALRQLFGDTGRRAGGAKDGRAAAVRRVRGSPVIWKEARVRIFRNRWRGLLGSGLVLAFLGVMYWLNRDTMDTADAHAVFTSFMLVYGLMGTAVIAAGTVPQEKEAGSWPLLLTTPLSEVEVAFGKAVGVLRRSLPAWAPMGFHLALFTGLGRMHVVALPLMALSVLSLAVFVTGLGLLFGTLVKRTVTATVLTLLVCAALWMVLPVMILFILAMMVQTGGRVPGAASPLSMLALLHPLVPDWLIMEGAAGEANAATGLADLQFHAPWLGNIHDRLGVVGTGVMLLAPAGIYVGAGLLAIRMAGRWLRQRLF
jgi:ABC-type transport system involved in multi-copper enzyme maturation permease subunit